MSTTTSPTRRVLGPKNPNAPLQQHTSKGSNTALQVASPASQRPAKRPLSRASSPAMSPRIGQKRKIEEVHETERADSQETNNNASDSSSQMTDLLSDSQSEMGDKSRTSMSQSKSTLNTTFTSFHGSQEEPPPVEPEFHILEEASQQTLDKMHAVTFTQNTSQLVPDLRPSLAPEASQVSLMSMSSLIDFDTHRSSQDDDMQMLEETESVTKDEPRKTDEDVRREMMLEKAETLRTRLQLAFYKIQTNQITQPFGRLQLPKPRSSSPDLPVPSSSTTAVGDSSISSLEAYVSTARARATSGPNPAVRALSSIPVPQILPTAFSARWNRELDTTNPATQEHQSSSQTSSSQTKIITIPSSPPLSQTGVPVVEDSNPRLSTAAVGTTPQEPKTPIQLSSPIASDDDDDEPGDDSAQNMKHRGGNKVRPRALTSSVVKGEAANSLLELVRGARSSSAGGGVGMSEL